MERVASQEESLLPAGYSLAVGSLFAAALASALLLALGPGFPALGGGPAAPAPPRPASSCAGGASTGEGNVGGCGMGACSAGSPSPALGAVFFRCTRLHMALLRRRCFRGSTTVL